MEDFSILPEVVWVHILSYLPFSDRRRVSLTCRFLHEVFHHPSLWDTVEIILSSAWRNNKPPYVHFISPDRHLQMLNSFGCYIRHLTLVYIGYIEEIPSDCKAVIEALRIKALRLENFILEVDIPNVSWQDMLQHSHRVMQLGPIMEIVCNASTLKSLSVRFWPNYAGLKGGDILSAIQDNKNSSKIKKLSLYWESAKDATWATLNAIMPPADRMLEISQTFINLTHLSIRSSMLNQDILRELSNKAHAPMERLNILLMYSRQEVKAHIPDIDSEVWQALHVHSPDLLVEVTVMTRIPYECLSSFLKKEIPIGGLGFMKYARVRNQDIQDITNKFSQTLQKFICLADPDDLEDTIMDMVCQCKNLRYFIFHGLLSYQIVQILAQMRGENWYRFEVFEDNIATQIVKPAEDENLIVRREEDGEVSLVHHQFQQQTQLERDEVLSEMCGAVSKIIGFTWHPATSNSIEQAINSTRLNIFADTVQSVLKAVPTKYAIASGWPWV